MIEAPKPRIPDSAEEWSLELLVFEHFNDTSLPQEVRSLIRELWREVYARKEWCEETQK